MDPTMSNLTDLIDRYIAMWNETDAERRRVLIVQTWTTGATYVDPALKSDGRAEIDAMVQTVQQRFPGYRFRRTGPVDTHHDRARFAWELAPEDGPAVVTGIEVALVAGDQLAAVTGFFDQVPAAA
jgi:acetaldehyde dehydrogenase (acetylating)